MSTAGRGAYVLVSSCLRMVALLAAGLSLGAVAGLLLAPTVVGAVVDQVAGTPAGDVVGGWDSSTPVTRSALTDPAHSPLAGWWDGSAAVDAWQQLDASLR